MRFSFVNQYRKFDNAWRIANILSYLAIKADSSETIKLWLSALSEKIKLHEPTLVLEAFKNANKASLGFALWKSFEREEIWTPNKKTVVKWYIEIQEYLKRHRKELIQWKKEITQNDLCYVFTGAILPYRDYVDIDWLQCFVKETLEKASVKWPSKYWPDPKNDMYHGEYN